MNTMQNKLRVIAVVLGSAISLALWSNQSNAAATITSVSPISNAASQTIDIIGSGFGAQSPYTGDSPNIVLFDGTEFSAGFVGTIPAGTYGTLKFPVATAFTDIYGLVVNSWTDTEIILGGIIYNSGATSGTLTNGDEVSIYVNNSGFSGTCTVVVGSGTGCTCPTNMTGGNNTAFGCEALYANTTGRYSAAFGYQALYKAQTGLGNIGVGPFAGQNIVQGALNIDIGSWGTVDESNTIRIGIPGYHDHTYLAGIYNSTGLSGLPVIVTSSGELGVAPVSSERFKTGIATMGAATKNLSQLRPVTFKLKSDAMGTVQYGLVAEEVAKVYPELVIRNENGGIDGVRYDELAPMLLNEMERQHAQMAEKIDTQGAKIASLEQQVAKVNDMEHELAEMRTALAALQLKEQVVAQR
jgi:hypothetical protein